MMQDIDLVDNELDNYEQHPQQLRTDLYQMLLLKQKDQATELLVTMLKRKHSFCTTRFDEQSEIYCYHEGIYKPQGKTMIKEYVRFILLEAYTEQLANRVIAKIEADTYIDQKQFLKRHYQNEVAVKNGILNIQTKELTPFTPKKIFLNKINATYNPEAQCPNINQFFADCLPEQKDIDTIHEWFGYCLMGGYAIQKIALFIGEGGNGKGQTLELLRSFLGEGNFCGIPLQKLEESDFKEYELFNKFANIGADISDQPLKETAKIKGLSGGDSINASVKFKNDLTFVNEAKLIFSANKLPKTYDLTKAFFRRWLYIVFPYRFLPENEYNTLPEEIKKKYKIGKQDVIKKILSEEELSGLLNLSLAGLERLMLNGNFTSSRTNEETERWWVRNSDSFMAFCYERIEIKPEGITPKELVRKAYQKFCRDNHLVAEGDKHIHEVLVRNFLAWDYQESEGERVWGGIEVKIE